MTTCPLIIAEADDSFARELASALAAPLKPAVKRVFADGEVLYHLPGIAEQQHLIVLPSGRTSSNLLELFILLDAAKRTNPASLTLVAPYLPYLRQDRATSAGSSVAASQVGAWLEQAGITKLVCLDPHNLVHLANRSFSLVALTALPLFVSHFQQQAARPVLVAPDYGVRELVLACAADLGLPTVLLNKEHTSTGPRFTLAAGTIANQDLLIFDDVVTSAASLLAAATFLRQQGASRVGAAVTHSLLTSEAAQKINTSRLAFLLTASKVNNNCPKLRYLSAASLVAKELVARAAILESKER